jgi:hypothetical protein
VPPSEFAGAVDGVITLPNDPTTLVEITSIDDSTINIFFVRESGQLGCLAYGHLSSLSALCSGVLQSVIVELEPWRVHPSAYHGRLAPACS